MTSVFVFFVWCFTGNFTVHKTPLLTTRPGLQSRDWNHSRREFWRTHFRPSWSVKTCDQLRDLVGRTRDWPTGYDIRGCVLLSWPVGWCFKSREVCTSALWRWKSWSMPVWSRLLSRLCTQTSVLAIHYPYYRHKCRVHKGGTESD